MDMIGGAFTSILWVTWLWRDSKGDLEGSAQRPLIQLFDKVF